MACSTGGAGGPGIDAGTVGAATAAAAAGDGERPRLPASAASPAADGGASVADVAAGDVPRTAAGSMVGGTIVRLAGESGAAVAGTDAVPAVGGVGGVGDCAGTDPLARVVSPVGPDDAGGGGDAIFPGLAALARRRSPRAAAAAESAPSVAACVDAAAAACLRVLGPSGALRGRASGARRVVFAHVRVSRVVRQRTAGKRQEGSVGGAKRARAGEWCVCVRVLGGRDKRKPTYAAQRDSVGVGGVGVGGRRTQRRRRRRR